MQLTETLANSEIRCVFITPNYKVTQTIIARYTEDKVTEIFAIKNKFCKYFRHLIIKALLEMRLVTEVLAYGRAVKPELAEVFADNYDGFRGGLSSRIVACRKSGHPCSVGYHSTVSQPSSQG